MMKNTFLLLAFIGFALASCDKVDNPYPPSIQGDWALYPDGDSAHYAANAWPTFTTNTNTNRNVLIEDFTGHQCIFCPAAAAVAHQLEEDNPNRVYVSTIHTGATGQMEAFQALTAPDYLTDFTTAEGFAIGFKFGVGTAGSPFQGNPYGTISRKDNGNGFPVTPAAQWTSATNSILAANDLKVNLQAASNYYPSTRGFFLHTEIDVIDVALTNELKVVVHIIEDSLIAPQKLVDNSTNYTYVHRDIFRGSIDGFTYGQTLDAAHLDANGNYYFNYIYELPSQYNASNMHVVIYVRDAVTEEIYQVIKHDIL
jgi:Outer membrane protein Omp28